MLRSPTSLRLLQRRTNVRKWFSGSPLKDADRQEYLREANKTMSEYHRARELMKQGKLPSKRQPKDDGTLSTQLLVGAFFIAAFLAMPFWGRLIARDKEFRQKYIPSWYDYTVKQEEGLTREQIHENILRAQLELRRRAIAGEFAPDKLEALKKKLEAVDADEDEEVDTSHWDKLHPGVDRGESVNED